MFRHYYESLCKYASGIISDPDEAEDIVQQTMIGIWEKRNSLHIQISLKSYLYRAIHNAALNRIRHQKVKAEHTSDHLYVATTASTNTHEIISGKELQEQINS